MPHVDHPTVVRDRIIVRVQLPDPRTKHVLVVEVNMPTSAEDAGFDQEEYNALVDAVRAGMNRAGVDEAEIIPI